MKIFLFICLGLVLSIHLSGQDLSRIVIRNGNPADPGFIVSLNGVRLSNDYATSVSFDFLDEQNYRIKVLQAGSRKVITLAVNSQPNYISQYIINKDNLGIYSLILESKSLMKGTQQTPTVQPVAEPTVAVNNGPQPMNETEYSELIKMLKKESLERSRLEMAQTFFADQHLSSNQVLGVLRVLSLENSRLTFAKFAYRKTVDKSSYFKVYDGLSLSNSKKEMSEYIKNNP